MVTLIVVSPECLHVCTVYTAISALGSWAHHFESLLDLFA